MKTTLINRLAQLFGAAAVVFAFWLAFSQPQSVSAQTKNPQEIASEQCGMAATKVARPQMANADYVEFTPSDEITTTGFVPTYGQDFSIKVNAGSFYSATAPIFVTLADGTFTQTNWLFFNMFENKGTLHLPRTWVRFYQEYAVGSPMEYWGTKAITEPKYIALCWNYVPFDRNLAANPIVTPTVTSMPVYTFTSQLITMTLAGFGEKMGVGNEFGITFPSKDDQVAVHLFGGTLTTTNPMVVNAVGINGVWVIPAGVYTVKPGNTDEGAFGAFTQKGMSFISDAWAVSGTQAISDGRFNIPSWMSQTASIVLTAPVTITPPITTTPPVTTTPPITVTPVPTVGVPITAERVFLFMPSVSTGNVSPTVKFVLNGGAIVGEQPGNWVRFEGSQDLNTVDINGGILTVSNGNAYLSGNGTMVTVGPGRYRVLGEQHLTGAFIAYTKGGLQEWSTRSSDSWIAQALVMVDSVSSSLPDWWLVRCTNAACN